MSGRAWSSSWPRSCTTATRARTSSTRPSTWTSTAPTDARAPSRRLSGSRLVERDADDVCEALHEMSGGGAEVVPGPTLHDQDAPYPRAHEHRGGDRRGHRGEPGDRLDVEPP